jgi:hypothetical protein
MARREIGLTQMKLNMGKQKRRRMGHRCQHQLRREWEHRRHKSGKI